MTPPAARRRPRPSLRVEALEDRRTPAAMLVEDFSNPITFPFWPRDGGWAIGATAAQASGSPGFNSDPDVDHSPTADNRVAGVVLAGAMPTAAGSTGYMSSPWMAVGNQPSLTLSFWRWLNAPGTPAMKHTVEVFDGDRWQSVFQTGSANVTDGAWTRESYDISRYASDAFRVRFGYQVLQAGGAAAGGWNVDDVTVGRLPVAGADALRADPGTAVAFKVSTLLANDADADGDAVKVDAVDARSAQGGAVTKTPTGYEYTPPAGFRGVDTFEYTLSEESGLTVRGTVRVVVGRPPTAAEDVFRIDPGSGVTFGEAALLANDSDPDGNALAFGGLNQTSANGVPIVGAIIPGQPVLYGYTPPAGFRGVDTTTYAVTDSTGLTTQGTVRFLVGRTPVAADDAFDTVQGAPRSFTAAGLLGNDADPDGDALAVSTFDAQTAGGGTVTFDGTKFMYKPAAGFHGTDSFRYAAADPIGLTAEAVVRIQVNGTPAATADAYATPEDQRLAVPAVIGLLANDPDPEGDPRTVSLVPGGGPAHGQLVLRPDGSFDYTPDPDFQGADPFTYAVTDGRTTATATATVHVVGIIDRPAAPDLLTLHDLGASDTDNYTPDRRPVFGGTAEPGASTVTLYVDGVPVGSTPVVGGAWTVGVPDRLAVGPRVVTATAADAAGNVSPVSDPLTVVIAGAPVGRVAVAATGAGALTVPVYDGPGARLFDLAPGWRAADGARIATGDVTGDGVADVALTPNAGVHLGTVVAYDGATGAELFRQAPLGPRTRLGIALGDVTGDGYADLLAAGLGGRGVGRVVGLSGQTRDVVFDWARTTGTTVRGVLAADADGDFKPDVLVFQTQRPFGTDVVAYNLADRTELRRYDGAKFGLTVTSRVAAGRMDGDERADLVVSTGGRAPKVAVISGADGETVLHTFATPGGAARAVAVADADGDGYHELVIGAARGRTSDGRVRVTPLVPGTSPDLTLDPFGPDFRGAIEV